MKSSKEKYRQMMGEDVLTLGILESRKFPSNHLLTFPAAGSFGTSTIRLKKEKRKRMVG